MSLTNAVTNSMTSNIIVNIPILSNIALMQKELLGNTLQAYLTSLLVLAVSLLTVLLIHRIITLLVKKWDKQSNGHNFEVILDELRKNILPLLYYGSLFLSTRFLKLSQGVAKFFNIVGAVLLTFFLLKFISSMVRYWLEHRILQKETDPDKIRTVQSIRPIINIFVWILGSIFLLSNLGFNISAVVAGLGISGIAIALAAQALLGDMFSYFSILLDRPFELGDFIIVGEFMGTVEHIGIKTTRLRSLNGEQLIFSNTDLTGSRVKNYKRMHERRVAFTIGVTYDTPLDKLETVLSIIKEAIQSQEHTRLDRCHFARYGASSLDYEAVYYVLTGDYNVYMDTQQAINLYIARQFAAQGVEFAFPTQTLYVKNDTKTVSTKKK